MESLMIDLALGFLEFGNISQRDNTFVGAGDGGKGAEHIFLIIVFIHEFAFENRSDLTRFKLIRTHFVGTYFALALLIDDSASMQIDDQGESRASQLEKVLISQELKRSRLIIKKIV